MKYADADFIIPNKRLTAKPSPVKEDKSKAPISTSNSFEELKKLAMIIYIYIRSAYPQTSSYNDENCNITEHQDEINKRISQWKFNCQANWRLQNRVEKYHSDICG
ncbi:hypothetical protein CDAR_52431 [Caerostris darwini]|uniref:Uncharacterized protein n=1 Tax=Caerostris darwini TaxID=1538125 RepID=A0AAV4S383_9ARAC|nr:hypothetical protein CDAR_52431 [Caerostris darwini]